MIEAVSAFTTGIPATTGIQPGLPVHPKTDAFGPEPAQAVDRVDEAGKTADSTLKSLATGENVDLHGTMIELEKADIALRTMVSVRDKAIGAYEAVMNMAI